MTDLKELERAIEQHHSTWYLAAKALEQISHERLYAPDYPSFRQYYRQRLKIGESRVFQLLRAGRAIDCSQIAESTTQATQAKINSLGLSEVHIRPICINRRSPQVQGQLIDSLVETAREADKLPSATIAKAVIKKAEAFQQEATGASSTPKKVAKGDRWQLGSHQLYCCDSVDWKPESRAVMCFADPPYNGGVDVWDNDFIWQHDYLEDVADYVFVTPGIGNLQAFLGLTKMAYRWQYTHVLSNGIAQPNAWGRSNTNSILLFSKEKTAIPHNSSVSDFRSDAVDQSQNNDTDHPGRKPLQLIQWVIRLATSEGDLIIDPFLGSGTTIIAAELEGRSCQGCEIEPEYCSAIIARWESVTGLEAQRV